ncbi:MAG: family ATPase, partial [Mycobacterium sp.]|nr:family ATPase [Mycobacterium sp.]
MRLAPAADAVAQSELLERDRELTVLNESLQVVRETSRGCVALIGGEAGVGKTALVRRFCDDRPRSVLIHSGSCAPLFTPRPLGPLLDMAEEVGGRFAQLASQGWTPHDAVGALVAELRARPGSILVLEDVHWADEATLDVLRLLSRKMATVPALVIATYRDDELAPDHPFRVVLGELPARAGVRRLRLAALSQPAVTQLAERHGRDAEQLFRRTAGNPFFVLEMLAAEPGDVPSTVREAVLSRAARLSPDARRLLEAAAVVPPQADMWLLEAIADEIQGVQRLDECLSSGMLLASATGVSFRHELARLAVEESVAPHRRLELHRRAVTALANPPVGFPDLARLAHHAEAAGDAEAVVRFAPQAGARAAGLGAHREAAAQYARALRFGDRLPLARRAELHERRAAACYLTDQYDEGIAALELALEYRRELGDKRLEGDALRRLSDFLWCPGRAIEAEQLARQAVALLEELPPGRELAHAYANLADSCAAAALDSEAVEWGHRAIELAGRLGESEIA